MSPAELDRVKSKDPGSSFSLNLALSIETAYTDSTVVPANPKFVSSVPFTRFLNCLYTT